VKSRRHPAFKPLGMDFRHLLLIFLFLLTISPEFEPFGITHKKLEQVSQVALINAYLTGQKNGLSKTLKKIHQDLNLQHLMTPSGLHLASLLVILGFFFKNPKAQFAFLLILGILVWPYYGLDSFKRMILFGLFRKNPLRPLSLKSSFFLTFAFAFALGQYLRNPLSFCLSFIFIGALIYTKNRLSTFITLGFLQIIIANWFENSFSPMGILIGLCLSLLSPIIFPLFILEALFPNLPFSFIWIEFLKALHSLILVKFDLSLLPIIPFFFYLRSYQLRRLALALSIFLTCLPLGHMATPSTYPSPPPSNFIKRTNLKNGAKFIYDNGMRCYSRLKGDEWSHHCHK
jgi:hypothetical protein